MKKLILSTVIILTSIFLFAGKSDGVKPLQELKFNGFDDKLTLVFKPTNSFSYTYLSSVDAEKASQIQNYVMKRKGVISCVTDLESKKITIELENQLHQSDFNIIMNSVRIKFLDPVDAPPKIEKDKH